MRFDSVFIFFFTTLSSVAVLHALAMQSSLYWIYPWFDIPMHFLGGAVAAFGFLSWIGERCVPLQRPTFTRTIAFVFLVGVTWELFEVAFGLRDAVAYAVDTSMDLVLDMLGGIVAFILTRSFKSIGI